MNACKTESSIVGFDHTTWPLLNNDPSLEEFELMSESPLSFELNSVNDEWVSSSDPFSDLDLNLETFDIFLSEPTLSLNNVGDTHTHINFSTATSTTTITNNNSNSSNNSSNNPSPTHMSEESDFSGSSQDEQQTPSPASSTREFFSPSQTSAPPSPWSPDSPLSMQPESPLGLATSESSIDFRPILITTTTPDLLLSPVVPQELSKTKLRPKEKAKRGRPPKKNLDRRTHRQKVKSIKRAAAESLQESLVRLSNNQRALSAERKKRKCMTEPEKKVHNELERRRRAGMALRLSYLKDTVDKIRDDPKASTKKIVDEAIVAIHDCKSNEKKLLVEKQTLSDLQKRLAARIASYINRGHCLTDSENSLSEDEPVTVV